MTQASLFAPPAGAPYVVQKVTAAITLEVYRGASEAAARKAFAELLPITPHRVELWARGADGAMYLEHVRAARRATP